MAKVAHAFPHMFTAHERRCADQTLRNYHPDAYERVTGVTLADGQSHARDRQVFENRRRGDWMLLQRSIPTTHPVLSNVALRQVVSGAEGKRRFLVPRCDYAAGRHGFVIDPRQHEPYDGPSSFVSWAVRK